MTLNLRSLLLIITFFCSFNLFGQSIKSFPHDSIQFQEEFLKFMDHPSKKKESKAFAEQFPTFWLSPNLRPEERQKIYQISDILLQKRARSFPDFYNYFQTLMLFQQQNRSASDFTNWHTGFLQHVSNKKVKLSKSKDFLIQTQHLLNDSIINKSYAVEWKAENAQFKYTFDEKLSIEFEKADLFCIAQRDTSTIYNTRGTYFPFEKAWKGNNGKISWERAGKDINTEYAIFDSYHIDASKSTFAIDTVQYFNPDLSDQALKGSLIEKAIRTKDPQRALYPRFESFEHEIKIDEIYEHVNYKGGVAIHGAKFIGKGSPEHPSEIQISRNDTLFLVAQSEHFAFQNNQIAGKDTKIEILIDTCRIYHPGLLFKYFPEKKELNLFRDGEGISKSPYFNNYHNLIMDFGMLVWRLDENMMHFTKIKGATKRQAHFESSNYFRMNRFMRIQGMDEQNPLVLLRKFADYIYVETFTAEEYANYIKKPVNQVRQQLFSLSFQGFVSYNMNTDEVTLQKRLDDYIKSGMGRQDYDVIQFTTQTEDKEADAIYFIGSSNLQINGVRQIAVSDSQNVVIFPKHRKIVLKKNRDFEFDGRLMAGLIDLHGKGFDFSYDNFKVDLKSIDSLQMNVVVDSLSKFGKRYTNLLGSVVENISGDLLIDDPNNKSGNKKFADYPIFNSVDSSYVFYDKPHIQDGVYKRDEFYFKVDPYTITNINNFDRSDIELAGTFVSDSIFPTFREPLTIREDNSLGFEHITPANGFSAYDKGVFTDTVFLSNQGLRGSGTVNYLVSETKSNDFIFLPEEMHTNAESFELKEHDTKMNNPEINGKQIYVQWFPYKDEMYVKSSALPLDMYQKLATLSGTLKITPNGITGMGNMELVNAEIKSNYFTYNRKNILADSASFKILNADSTGYSFETESVNANIDFVSRTGTFENTKADKKSIFPDNRYMSYINNFKWYMDEQMIDFGKEDEATLAALWQTGKIDDLDEKSLNTFISIDPKQDSLSFVTPLARYDAMDNTISAKFVKSINVADAKLYPDSGNVAIAKGARMETFRNAEVIADTINQFHRIYDATINVHGKNSYSGSGSYTYKTADGKEQLLSFDVIDVDSTGQTIAMGNITEEKAFTLSPHFDYKGKVKLEARDSALFFDGQAHIHNKCGQINDNWLDFKSKIDPNEILIPVDLHAIDDDRLKLYNSFFLTNDSIHIYSSFLSRRIFYTDNVLLDAKGYLTYNEKIQAYQIAEKEKLRDPNVQGSMISFYQNNCNIKGEGKVDLGAELGQIKQVASGNIEHDLSSNIVTLDLIYGVDFFMNDQAMKIMENDFANATVAISKLNKKNYTKKIAEIMGKAKAEKAMLARDANGLYKELPKELKHTIYFNNLDFIWDKETKAYQSIGDIGIGNINGKQINKSVKGKVELDKKRSGNKLTIYLEIDKSTWYFFQYHHGVMFVRSSNDEFNTIVTETKEDKREFKDPLKKNPYSYIITQRSKKTKFLKRMNFK
ncbi:hypothetical protein [Marinifilum flexuosum]|uniref:hypothetical protein n=1 Tax=Marinifilum flexuosum TaxID=1117708 RepID=UPI002493EE7C|nr:hypothetical protein [Marinifilum flexuosum]